MGIISYTIACDKDNICTDIIYESLEQAVSEAVENGVKAFQFEWDGIDARTITNLINVSKD